MNPHASLIAEILKIPGAQDAFAVALDGEWTALIPDLRNAVAAGDTVKAASIEGQMQAIEKVLGILTSFAEKAHSHQE